VEPRIQVSPILEKNQVPFPAPQAQIWPHRSFAQKDHPELFLEPGHEPLISGKKRSAHLDFKSHSIKR
jgi:hypothetical protein